MSAPVVKPSTWTDIHCSKCHLAVFTASIVNEAGENSMVLECAACGREYLFVIDLSPQIARTA